MSGKRGLVMGVANDHSIAWGIAKALSAHGAELAFTYQGEALGKRVAARGESRLENRAALRRRGHRSVDAVFADARKKMGSLDFRRPLHRLFRPQRTEGPLRRHVAREFRSHDGDLGVFLHRIRQARRALMPNGGAMLTLTFGGATRVMPNYNVMGVAKAALEASVRYLAADFGPQGIRVNAISAGPIRTLGGRRHRRRALHVQFPARSLAAAAHGDDRGRRRRGALSAVEPVRGRHRRNSFRRFGL
jgi:enoyl-[acyl-carrier protein] reductase I